MKKFIISAALLAASIASANAFTLEQTERFAANYESQFGVELSRGQANGILNKFAEIRENNDNARGVIGRSRVIAEFESHGVVDLDNTDRYTAGARAHNKYWSDVRDTVGVNTADVFQAKHTNARAGLSVDKYSAEYVERQNIIADTDFVQSVASAEISKFNNVQRVAGLLERDDVTHSTVGLRAYIDIGTFPAFYNIWSGSRDVYIAGRDLRNERRDIAEAAAQARADLVAEVFNNHAFATNIADILEETGVTVAELNDYIRSQPQYGIGGVVINGSWVVGFSSTGLMLVDAGYNNYR